MKRNRDKISLWKRKKRMTDDEMREYIYGELGKRYRHSDQQLLAMGQQQSGMLSREERERQDMLSSMANRSHNMWIVK